jgi:hypothetical protein
VSGRRGGGGGLSGTGVLGCPPRRRRGLAPAPVPGHAPARGGCSLRGACVSSEKSKPLPKHAAPRMHRQRMAHRSSGCLLGPRLSQARPLSRPLCMSSASKTSAASFTRSGVTAMAVSSLLGTSWVSCVCAVEAGLLTRAQRARTTRWMHLCLWLLGSPQLWGLPSSALGSSLWARPQAERNHKA